MPLGKYYCDYCDKEFKDTPVARKRHLQSTSHLRNKSLWFNSLHSTTSLPLPPPPPVIHNPGFAPFGAAPPPRPLQGGDVVRDNRGTYGGNVIPPSLQPPPEGGYLPLPFVDWG